jgi:hypothetical protein
LNTNGEYDMIVDDIPFEQKLDCLVKTVNLPHLLIMSEESVKSLKKNKERLESTNEESCFRVKIRQV